MAGSNPLSAFAGAEASTDAQKAALGSLIAAQGSAGAESYKAEQAVAQEVAKNAAASVPANNPGIGNPAASSAVGPGQLTQMLAARAAAPGQLGAQQMGQAGTEFTKYAGLIGNANSSYMDAVKAATPIVRAQADAEVRKIQEELAMRREERQAELNAREEDRRWQERTRGWAIQDRMIEEAEMKRALAAEERGEDMPYSSGRVRDALGWSEGKVNDITNSNVYNDVYPEAMNRLRELGPTADRSMVEGMVQAILNTPNAAGVTYGDRPDIKRFIVAQLMGALGQPPTARASTPAFNPATGDKDTPPTQTPPGTTTTIPGQGGQQHSASAHYTALRLSTMSQQSLDRVIRESGANSEAGRRARIEKQRRANDKTLDWARSTYEDRF